MSKRLGYLLLLLPAMIILLGVFLIPMLFILLLSLEGAEGQFSWSNYLMFFQDTYYLEILGRTISLSLYTVACTLLLAYPVAMFMARTQGKLRGLVTMLILCPHLISVVIRNFGWVVILGDTGWLNTMLLKVGIIETPLRLLYNELGIVIGLTDAFIAYMVLAIATSLYTIDASLYKAASILGATRLQSFFHITLPLSMPGVFAGITLVFSLSMSAYVTPALMGGTSVKVIPVLAFEQIMSTLNWPLGAALAILLLSSTVVLVTLFSRLVETKRYKEVFTS
ncbi:ABC transporter permease [Brevibacillus laterosporus]|uniref:ABC-type spermidine/putrescine transport system, permease n=1 Tax=Brevibacillus laterosporus LMG 15441 TaxID=1042163 RepID=A0A075R4G7_BRELA|nr:ABC transporter permease [Brevibacillus laterosporus]AIG26068.1 ABC-type spermidine/putrescine transport system, permease [Brevibacillus laterosporus LMG 15441]AUM64695.1 ABC transporter permease [Brevibacillus laterosporus]AYK07615.1 ABC transporter permease [Brevibacillus laterosporus]RJL07953.1 ABC transporter permease [Brevibacillus laterosporus]TPH17888.1 ABC transporter permease [Brevibacillus laterosporus]